MKTIKAEASASRTGSVLDLSEELAGLTKAQKKELLDQVGELLVDQTLQSLADQRSPLSGYGKFKKLSDHYAEFKKEVTGSTDANLDLHGDMIRDLDFRILNENQIQIAVYGDSAAKADGHNNISGDSSLPLRRFLPDEGESYNNTIKALVKELVTSYRADNLDASSKELKEVTSSAELYAILKKSFPSSTKSQIRESVMGSEFAEKLDRFDLLGLL